MAQGSLVLGLDVGGSTSRALLAAFDGRRRGTGRAGGGNPTARDAESAAAAIGDAVSEALGATDPALVAGVTIGLAGGGMLATTPAAAEAFGRMWERTGITCPVVYAPDALVAFAAGTPEPDGSLLLSGTGAVGIGVRDGRMTARSDGHGWLLGDRGSGFWLARAAVVAVLAELDGPGPATALTPLVLAALFGESGTAGDDPAESVDAGIAMTESYTAGSNRTALHEGTGPALDIVLAVRDRTPGELAELAPLVTAACADGDPVAQRIVDRAAEHLLATLAAVRSPGETTPIVLSGSVLLHDTPVAAGVRRGVAEQWPEAPVSQASDGAAGAAWLAIRQLPGEPPPGTYARLLSTSIANEQNLRTYRAPEHSTRERTTPPPPDPSGIRTSSIRRHRVTFRDTR